MSDVTKEEREALRIEFEILMKERTSNDFNRKYSDYCTNDGPEWFYENEVFNAAFEGFILGRQSSPEKAINQCDVCQAGIPVVDGRHRYEGEVFGFGCTAYRYAKDNDRCVNYEEESHNTGPCKLCDNPECDGKFSYLGGKCDGIPF